MPGDRQGGTMGRDGYGPGGYGGGYGTAGREGMNRDPTMNRDPAYGGTIGARDGSGYAPRDGTMGRDGQDGQGYGTGGRNAPYGGQYGGQGQPGQGQPGQGPYGQQGQGPYGQNQQGQNQQGKVKIILTVISVGMMGVAKYYIPC